MRIYRLPRLLRYVYRGAKFSIQGESKTLYLTFDDGPTDGVTQKVLEVLEKRGVRATFFVNGINVSKNQELFNSLPALGHTTGNHGYLHLNGFQHGNKTYLNNVIEGARISGSDLYRPPYGKITPSQFIAVRKKYQVVFWTLIPYDFDITLSPDKILATLKKGIRPGSIIALHDNRKSQSPEILDDFIQYSFDEGYSFKNMDKLNPIR